MLGELTDDEIDAVLREETLGRIGCHAHGMTYVVPVSYVFDGSSVFVLSTEGLKLQIMRENPRVCLEVEQIRHWTNWKSVLAWGTFEELTGQRAQETCKVLSRMTLLVQFKSKRCAHGQSRAPGTADRPHVLFRIALEERSGRFERL